jgi:adenylate cyclase
MLAIWKGSRSEATLRRQACLAALGVAKAVANFREANKTLTLSTRIGLHAGQIFLGNIGAGDHYKWGPTGDTVNTASRMEGLNKYLGTGILVTEEVIRDLDDFLLRAAGKFTLKGKAQAVGVYELICLANECTEKQKTACEVFAHGVEAFQDRSWLEAENNFYQCIEQLGEDKLSCFYLDLCANYKQKPPCDITKDIWNGAISMEEK